MRARIAIADWRVPFSPLLASVPPSRPPPLSLSLSLCRLSLFPFCRPSCDSAIRATRLRANFSPHFPTAGFFRLHVSHNETYAGRRRHWCALLRFKNKLAARTIEDDY